MRAHLTTSIFDSSRPVLLAALTALGALGAAGCASHEHAPAAAAAAKHVDHADLSNEITATAAVVSVDKPGRLVTLRSEDGSLFTVEAGPEVRNFEQIVAGDQLKVHYQQTLSATLRPAGDSAAPAAGAVVAGRAAPGSKPAAGVGAAISVRVKIESVDRAQHIVVFSLSSGELRTVRAQRPEGRAFVEGLKVGDIVQLDYTEALALSIEKA